MNFLRKIFGNYEILKKGGPNFCVVIRFDDPKEREKGLRLLYENIHKEKKYHLEKRRSQYEDIRYRRRRSYAEGSYVIVSENNSGYSDTWHTQEFQLLNQNNISFIDIDKVGYYEIEEVTIKV